MSNHRKNGGLDTETKTMLGLIAVFFLGAVGSYIFGSPILTAVCAGLIVTALLYRFFGGVEGSTFTVATFKASGSVAVFAFVTWFVNGELVKQKPIPTAIPVVESSPSLGSRSTGTARRPQLQSEGSRLVQMCRYS